MTRHDYFCGKLRWISLRHLCRSHAWHQKFRSLWIRTTSWRVTSPTKWSRCCLSSCETPNNVVRRRTEALLLNLDILFGKAAMLQSVLYSLHGIPLGYCKKTWPKCFDSAVRICLQRPLLKWPRCFQEITKHCYMLNSLTMQPSILVRFAELQRINEALWPGKKGHVDRCRCLDKSATFAFANAKDTASWFLLGHHKILPIYQCHSLTGFDLPWNFEKAPQCSSVYASPNTNNVSVKPRIAM